MSAFGPEAAAVEWLHSHFSTHPELSHLRARRRGRVVTIESGPDDDVVSHARLRRDTVSLWFLEMPARNGRWDKTPFRGGLELLLEVLQSTFPWTLQPIHENPDGTSDPGY